jgi:hypothetical protein
MAPAARKNAAMMQAVMGLEIIEDGSKKGEVISSSLLVFMRRTVIPRMNSSSGETSPDARDFPGYQGPPALLHPPGPLG